jgi:hypothetical protein
LPTRIVRLNQNAQPLDDIQLSSDSDCPNSEFTLACNRIDVDWNPISNEFGVLYSDGGQRRKERTLTSSGVEPHTLLAPHLSKNPEAD